LLPDDHFHYTAHQIALTSGWCLRIAMRRLRCGSSVYIHKKSCGSRSPLAAAAAGSGSSERSLTLGADETGGEGVTAALVALAERVVGRRAAASAVVVAADMVGVGARGGKGWEGVGGGSGGSVAEDLRSDTRPERGCGEWMAE
jgi:hypothetical protein